MEDEEDSIWIKTESSSDGKSFVVTVDFDSDHSLTLDKQAAFKYAHAILTAVQYAEYDAAVFEQIKEKVPDEKAGAQMVVDMRKQRPDPDFTGFEPFSLLPGVSAFTGEPYLTVILDGKHVGQWDLDAARHHAMMAIESLVVADLDQLYLNQLTKMIRLPEGTARKVVADLVRFR